MGKSDLPIVKWLGVGAVNPLVVDGKGGKEVLIPAVRRWVAAHGRNVTLPSELACWTADQS